MRADKAHQLKATRWLGTELGERSTPILIFSAHPLLSGLGEWVEELMSALLKLAAEQTIFQPENVHLA